MKPAELPKELRQVYDFAYAANYAAAMDQAAFDPDPIAATAWADSYAVTAAIAAVDTERSRLAAINLGD